MTLTLKNRIEAIIGHHRWNDSYRDDDIANMILYEVHKSLDKLK